MIYVLTFIIDSDDKAIKKGYKVQVVKHDDIQMYSFNHPLDGDEVFISFEDEDKEYSIEERVAND